MKIITDNFDVADKPAFFSTNKLLSKPTSEIKFILLGLIQFLTHQISQMSDYRPKEADLIMRCRKKMARCHLRIQNYTLKDKQNIIKSGGMRPRLKDSVFNEWIMIQGKQNHLISNVVHLNSGGSKPAFRVCEISVVIILFLIKVIWN